MYFRLNTNLGTVTGVGEEVDYCGNCVALCRLRLNKERAAGRTTSGSLSHLSRQTNRAMTKVIALFVVGRGGFEPPKS